MVIDEKILITGSDDHSIRLWNLSNFSPAGTVGTHQSAVQSLVFIEGPGLLLSACQSREVICWIYQKYRKLESFLKNEDIMCMEYISEENQLLIGTDSGKILNHDIAHYIHFDE